MIGYVTLGSNDLERATQFYDSLMAELGAARFPQGSRLVFWGKGPGKPMLAVCNPHDGQPASAGNGVMIALGVRDTQTVDRVYQRAMALDAGDEGAPGPRGDDFYGAYFRDPDGNKLCVFTYSGKL